MTELEDVKSNVFTEEGRLLQTEYAIKNVSKAGTIMGRVCNDGVVLIGVNLAKVDSREKIYKISENIYCAVAGLFGDANRLIKFARGSACNKEFTYGSPMNLNVLCKFIAWEKQRYTLNANTRPFGVSFLYAGYNKKENIYELKSTDPSGTINSWVSNAIGLDSEAINLNLLNLINEEESKSEAKINYDNGVYINTESMEEGTITLLKSFVKAKECPNDIYDRLEILHFTKDKKIFLKKEEIKRILINNEMILE